MINWLQKMFKRKLGPTEVFLTEEDRSRSLLGRTTWRYIQAGSGEADRSAWLLPYTWPRCS